MQYKIRFAPRSDPDNIQRTTINAESEAEARDIFSDPIILDVEPLMPLDSPQWTPAIVAAGEDYDATPCPPQPVIVLDDVEEFPF